MLGTAFLNRLRQALPLLVATIVFAFSCAASAADFGAPPSTQTILTDDERGWVRAHPVIRVQNDSNLPPVNFTEDGRPSGYSIDFMNLVAERVGLQVEYVPGPFSAFPSMLQRGELDALLNVIRTPEREKFLRFTPPYARLMAAILSAKGEYSAPEQLAGKTLAVLQNAPYEDLIRRITQT